MKTDWNYTELAESYLERPDYSVQAIDNMLEQMHLSANAKVCDVGAGVAHLTKLLARRNFWIDAVEPNDRMRELGKEQTRTFENVTWYEGTGEATGRPSENYELVTFGSSFNVTDRIKALAETRRILKKGGWFACMWNHRNLEDPIQKSIETVIAQSIPGYTYGTRREDQRQFLEDSGYFEHVYALSGDVIHQQTRQACLTAWRSHATLQRQAGEKFEQIISGIEAYLHSEGIQELKIPYTTRIWFGRLRESLDEAQ